MSNILWVTSNFEEETFEGIVNKTAIYGSRCGFTPDKYLTLMTPLGEINVGDDELKTFNDLVEKKIEEIYSSRSDSQKYDDYMSDCADNNHKERD